MSRLSPQDGSAVVLAVRSLDAATPPTRSAWPERVDIALGGIVFALSFALYVSNAIHLEPWLPVLDHTPFGGDAAGSARAMRALVFEWKHPLFSISTWPLVACLTETFRITPSRAVQITVAALAAANMTLAFAILRKLVCKRILAVWFTGLYALLSANLLIFSIPETYSASNLAILAYLLAFVSMRERLGRRETTQLALLAGIASLFNPPLLSLLVIHTLQASQTRGARHALAVGARSLAIAAAIFFSVSIAGQAVESGEWTRFFAKSGAYTERFASVSHFWDARIVATVPLVFFVYGSVARIGLLQIPAPEQLGDYLGSPAALIFLALYSALAVALLAQCARGKHRLEASLLPWIGALVLFYVYWCPDMATRFSTQALFPVTMILARAFARLRSRFGLEYDALVAASLCLALHNLHALYGMR